MRKRKVIVMMGYRQGAGDLLGAFSSLPVARWCIRPRRHAGYDHVVAYEVWGEQQTAVWSSTLGHLA